MHINVLLWLSPERSGLISAGLSDNPLPKKAYDKLVVDRLPGTDILSVKSFGSADVMSSGVEEIHTLQR